jgi:predicted ATPase
VPTEGSLTLANVRFRNFNALRDFSISFRHMNILVGPNNSGKSTVIGAFRVLAAGIQRARSRSPEFLPSPGGLTRRGHRVPDESIPISLENVHTDYADVDSTVTFHFTDDSEIVLFFPRDGGCYFFPLPAGRQVVSSTGFKSSFPFRVGVVPVLGQVENDEPLVQEATVRRNLATHRASRNFRNYWLWAEGFEAFRDRVRDTWPGMEIEKPFVVTKPGESTVAMFCAENRTERELYWAGAGFQIWCQLLTHLVREEIADLVVVDEPEIYLHPDLQRQLLVLLRDLGPDVLIATHSPEIVSQAEPSDILLVDKRSSSAKRVTGVEGVRAALSRLGSIQNVALTQLARTRRVVFVEGDDFRLIAQFARRLGLTGLASASAFAVIETGGFPDASALRSIADGMQKAVERRLIFAGVFDRDYRTDEEATAVTKDLQFLRYCHILVRKEIENYLLVPSVLDRALEKALRDRAKRTGLAKPGALPVAEHLVEVTDGLRVETYSQLLAMRLHYLKRTGSGLHEVTVTKDFTSSFEAMWTSADLRLEVVPGKDCLSRLNGLLQARYQVSLTPATLAAEFRVHEIPGEIASVIRALDSFAVRAPESNAASPEDKSAALALDSDPASSN